MFFAIRVDYVFDLAFGWLGRMAKLGFDKGLAGVHRRGVKTRDDWVRQVKGRLKQAGFEVSLLDPARGVAKKESARRRDRKLIESGKFSPEALQKRNSLFGGRAKAFCITDYGGLDQNR